jgi:hypothetical protein
MGGGEGRNEGRREGRREGGREGGRERGGDGSLIVGVEPGSTQSPPFPSPLPISSPFPFPSLPISSTFSLCRWRSMRSACPFPNEEER